jgi:hypothetical protein
MKNSIKQEIHKLGKMIGLNENDIALMLNDSINEQYYFSTGPPWYPGGRYGTISINDFK